MIPLNNSVSSDRSLLLCDNCRCVVKLGNITIVEDSYKVIDKDLLVCDDCAKKLTTDIRYVLKKVY